VNKARSLVLFDVDGTLLRGAGPHHKQALIEGIRRVTGVLTHLDGVSTSGMLDQDLLKHMLRASGQSERRIRMWLRQIMAECQDAYFNDCALDLRPFVCIGVRETLAELQARGAALGLVTGNLSRIGRRKLELAGLSSYFSTGAFAEDGRTRARLARVAAQRAIKAGLIAKTSRISLVGDHANDVAAAKANGFQAIAVATGLMPFEELKAAGPDILIRDLTELDFAKVL
jgi:phosphoglycolate phosphatase-like HAD superfamily hydrolase